LQVQVLNASTSNEIEVAFAALVRDHIDALFASGDAFFTSTRAIPTIAATSIDYQSYTPINWVIG
jgi:hypothetical protein